MDIGGEGGLPLGIEQNDSNQPANLSDVLEVISLTDPSFGGGSGATMSGRPQTRVHASVQIVEQPASKALRFRYECEGRSAGSIPGANSTPENKTFPTIKICGYVGPVTIVVSCVTKDEPYRPHPHNLVGRERCEKGVCSIKANITEDSNTYHFKNLGIQCVKRRDIAEALQLRAQLRVDPFRTGFEHKNHPQSVDLNAVRLAFQVFIPNSSGEMRCQLSPVCSDVIYDKKAMCDLHIARASHCSGTVTGGTKIILLCEKVTREDTAVVFYQEEAGRVVWEQAATIFLVHKQVAIAFEAPPYPHPLPTGHVNVQFQLKRLTDNARSNSLPFEYTPEQDTHYLGIKKRKTLIPSILQTSYEPERAFHFEQIKAEPDKTPPHHMGSSPHRVYSPHYDQNWAVSVDPMRGLAVPGQSHVTFGQDMHWNTPYAPQATSPNVQHMSPEIGHAPSNMGQMSPHLGPHSPNMGHVSPNLGGHSPNMVQVLPNLGPHSPNMAQVLPNLGPHSPIMGQVLANSPSMGQVLPSMGSHSPNICQVGPSLGQQPVYSQAPPQQPMDTQSSISLSGLLNRGEAMGQLNSGELSSLLSTMMDRNPDLSDSLNRLSTSDLLL